MTIHVILRVVLLRPPRPRWPRPRAVASDRAPSLPARSKLPLSPTLLLLLGILVYLVSSLFLVCVFRYS